MIDRSQDARHSAGSSGDSMPRTLFGTRVAEPILAAVIVRPRQQTGHMIAIDSIRTLPSSCKPGAVHIWVPAGACHRAGRRPDPLAGDDRRGDKPGGDDYIALMNKPSPRPLPASIDATVDLLAEADYIADRSLATAVFLALELGRPLLLEGEAGVGKTELAKVLATSLGAR